MTGCGRKGGATANTPGLAREQGIAGLPVVSAAHFKVVSRFPLNKIEKKNFF